MTLRYDVGTKIQVEVEIVEIDKSSYPYYIEVIGLRSPIGDWITEEQLEDLIDSSNPELKRKRLQSEIEKLQKELEEIE